MYLRIRFYEVKILCFLMLKNFPEGTDVGAGKGKAHPKSGKHKDVHKLVVLIFS